MTIVNCSSVSVPITGKVIIGYNHQANDQCDHECPSPSTVEFIVSAVMRVGAHMVCYDMMCGIHLSVNVALLVS
jgi:hypothetical protein